MKVSVYGKILEFPDFNGDSRTYGIDSGFHELMNKKSLPSFRPELHQWTQYSKILSQFNQTGWKFFHPFAGVGMNSDTIKAFGLVPQGELFWERDQNCVDIINAKGLSCKKVDDSYVDILDQDFNQFNFIAIDPNGVTLYNPWTEKFWAKVKESNYVGFIHVVDSAASRVHLQRKTYSKKFGVDIDSWMAYINYYQSFVEKQDYELVLCVNEWYVFQLLFVHKSLRNKFVYPQRIVHKNDLDFSEIFVID